MMKIKLKSYQHIRKQQGMVLVVILIILFALTVVAVSNLQSTALEEKISDNLQEKSIARQTANVALVDAENVIEGLTDTTTFGSTNGRYLQGTAPSPFSSSTWSGSQSVAVTTSLPGVVTPRYFIEMLGTYSGSKDINIYNYGQNPQGGSVIVFRIVARGTGSVGQAEVILESFYGKRL